jgi:hypothetical protein
MIFHRSSVLSFRSFGLLKSLKLLALHSKDPRYSLICSTYTSHISALDCTRDTYEAMTCSIFKLFRHDKCKYSYCVILLTGANGYSR